jgi:hypothetical protein
MKDNVVYQDTVAKAVIPCGFCATKSHDSCKGGYRNGNGSVLICGCECADNKPQFCHHCHTIEPDFLGRPWLCDDRDECENRLRVRLAGSPLMTLIRETRPTQSTRSRKGCLCCGEPTKGGKFLPGHDSKYLNTKIAECQDKPYMPVYNQLAAEVSPAFAEKFKKRVYG